MRQSLQCLKLVTNKNVLVAIAVLMAIGIPEAMASNSPSYGGTITVAGADTTLTVTADPTALPHEGREVIVVDILPALYLPVSGCDGMTFGTAPATNGGTVWELRDSTGTYRIGYKLDSGESVSYKWGPVTGTSTTVIPSATAEVYIANNAGYGDTTLATYTSQGTGTSVSAKWVKINAGPASSPDTSRVGLYNSFTCGIELLGTSPYTAPGPFLVQKPVGGSILPIDATSLVLAGIQSNALWMLPTLGAIASATFGILYFQIKRNQ